MGLLSDIGNAASSAVGAVGDLVEGAVDLATEAAGDLVDTVLDGVQDGLGWANGWLCRSAGAVGCWVGNVVLGGVSGLLEGIQDIGGGILDIVRGAGGFVGALLHFDLARAIAKLGEIAIAAVDLVLAVVRLVTAGTLVNGIREAWQAQDLRRFVEDLVWARFESNPPQLARVRAHLGLDGVGWGLALQATHKTFRLDSAKVELWRWHEDGIIDLFAMAGWVSGGSFHVARSRTEVRSVSADGQIVGAWPISRWTLAKYINSRGRDGRIHVYARSRDAVEEAAQVATDRCKKLGLRLQWSEGQFHDITTLDELDFDRRGLGDYLIDQGLRRNAPGEPCDLLALAAFRLVKGLGQAAGRNISEGASASGCRTLYRDDSCCVTVDTTEGSGVIYRDEWPPRVFKYVLAHEVGHYVGLCHYGHDGFQNIMFTAAEEAGLSLFDRGLLEFYLDDDPSFSLLDAKNTWRFLVGEMAGCLDPDAGAAPVVL